MNDFQPSEELIEFAKQKESYVRVPAPDPVGVITWGYGHARRAHEVPPPEISEADACALLAADMGIAAGAVRRHVTTELDQVQFDALCDWAFNLGEGNLSSSTMLQRVNERDWEAAATECERWVHAGGRVLPGLVTRRAWEATRLRSGTPAIAQAPAEPVDPADVVQGPNPGIGDDTRAQAEAFVASLGGPSPQPETPSAP